LFLEYLSTLPPEETYRNLGDVGNVLGAIGERLNKRQSHYASVFEALLEMADRKPDLKEIEEAVKKDSGKIPDLAEIDQQWEEQFAFENTDQTTGAGGCPAAEDMLRRINIPLTNDKTQKETV
jgi:nitrate reductase delta subunit